MNDPNGDRIRRLLASDAKIEPSPDLDARVRGMLRERPAPAPSPLLHPAPAIGLALGAFLAMVASIASPLAEAGAAEYGPLIAVALGTVYLALSAAATLPLLLCRLARSRDGVEVRA